MNTVKGFNEKKKSVYNLIGTTLFHFFSTGFHFFNFSNLCLRYNAMNDEIYCYNSKAPTSILTKPNGDFHSFGYEAEQHYSQLKSHDVGPDHGYNIYRHFKMLLHKEVSYYFNVTHLRDSYFHWYVHIDKDENLLSTTCFLCHLIPKLRKKVLSLSK